ncbi:MAG: 23S rRNA (adenine(2503)-C(2))-methyltransferase RlmN, partial [Saprospiraceae bacterium]
MTVKPDIRTQSIEDLRTSFVQAGMPVYRAKQVFDWMWKLGARSFDEMSNVPLSMRNELAQKFSFNGIQVDVRQSSADGTSKTRYKLHDNHKIETVLIPVPDDKRFTACVSSQVGCSLTCSFCATGQMGRLRNLTAAEIYDQAYDMNRLCVSTYQHPLTNIVYMGMGEPLLNY